MSLTITKEAAALHPALWLWLQQEDSAQVVDELTLSLGQIGQYSLIVLAVSPSTFYKQMRWLQTHRPMHPQLGIIFLADTINTSLVTELLEAGADDVLGLRLMSQIQLRARLKSWLRRLRPHTLPPTQRLGQLEWHPEARVAVVGNQRVQLQRLPAELLQLLLQYQGRPLSRQHIVNQLWTSTDVTPNAIDAHISYLRRQVFQLLPSLTLTTLYGYGYRLSATM